MIFSINSDVQIFNTEGEIRFRKGVWNFTEAIILVGKESEEAQKFYKKFVQELIHVGSSDVEKLFENISVTNEEFNQIKGNVNSLEIHKFIISTKLKKIENNISSILAGKEIGLGYPDSVRPVAYITDSTEIAELVKGQAKALGLPVDILDSETVNEIAFCDLTSKMEAIKHEKILDTYKKIFAPYAAIGYCFSSPKMTLLRNVNRICIESNTAMVGGIIDGPFLSMFAIDPKKTGCWECLEHRIMARLQDITAYQEFAKNVDEKRMIGELNNKGFLPYMTMLASLTVTELYTLASLHLCRMMGRVLSIYLPVFEIQCQDLLRVPYCSACGNVSQAKMDEMYTSSRAIVEEMLDKIELAGA